MREEEKLTDTADFLEQQAKSSKSRLTVGDGNLEIGEHRDAQFDIS
jgi:hypothetical protein